jgi:HK97 gp10 family phage protein
MSVTTTDSGKFKKNKRKVKFAMEQAVIRIAMLAAQDARRAAPIDTGRLKRSITVSKPFGTKSGGVGAFVGTNVIYAAMQEFGGMIPARAEIKPVKRKALKFKTGGQTVIVARVVNWPGAVIPAQPYLRPALERRKRTAKKLFARMMVRALTR